MECMTRMVSLGDIYYKGPMFIHLRSSNSHEVGFGEVRRGGYPRRGGRNRRDSLECFCGPCKDWKNTCLGGSGTPKLQTSLALF